jgi:hypothetical protein
MDNALLNKAKRVANDEFYTRLEDIEEELQHYKKHFKDKIVYLNCDDPKRSHFYTYFSENFKSLELKGLLTSYIKEDGSGGFSSDTNLELLKICDIVVTNPPFSLFREFVEKLMEYDKKFLIIGNGYTVVCKDIFKYVIHKRLWMGVDTRRDKSFQVPDDAERWSTMVESKKYATSPTAWYTNLEHNKRRESLVLTREYSEEEYPTYDNYNAIEVGRVMNIPLDYAGIMGVPVTYLGKHNPDQFEIVGISEVHGDSVARKVGEKRSNAYLGGKKLFTRLFIRRVRGNEEGQ